MNYRAILSSLRRLLEWLCPCRRELRQIIKQQGEIKMKLSELLDALSALDDQIDKAQAEILAKIAALEAALVNVEIPADAQAKIDELKAAAQSLDDIVPDQP